MVEVCKTKDLRDLIPWELGVMRLSRRTGISQRSFYRIRECESYETNEKTADEVLSKLGLVHLYYTLDFYEPNKDFSIREHGINAYKKGCRCACCRRAHLEGIRKYRRNKGMKQRPIGPKSKRYNAELN